MLTPEFTIRSFTDDQYILDKVFYANNYRLKKLPEEEPAVIVDIGAHSGFFSLLCLMRGADKVYSVEPFTDNFRVLSQNLESFQDKSSILKMGVYTENRFGNLEYPTAENNFFYLSSVKFHNGVKDEPSDLSYFVTLDELLGSLPEPEVTLLKINIGYAETDILLSSKNITKCKYVCGETSASEEKLAEVVAHMKDQGFNDSYMASSKEKEGQSLVLFAKEKCEDLFNLYVSGSPEEAAHNEEMASNMTPIPQSADVPLQ